MSALRRALDAHLARDPEGEAVRWPEGSWTWRELAERVDAVRLEVGRTVVEARIVTLLPALVAGEAAGACVVPWDSRESARPEGGEGFPGVVISTSGTSGAHRAARLPWTALVASAQAVNRGLDLRAGDAWLSALRLAHVGGVGVMLRCVLAGATMVLSDRFSVEFAVEELGRVTHASFVARMLERVLEQGPETDRLRAVMVGGGPSAEGLLRRARAAGIPTVATYGLTEACSTVTVQRPGDPVDGSAGRPLDGVSVRVVGEAIQVRGPTVFAGYDPPHEARIEDGWLVTGDLGWLEGERLFVDARREDRIVTGGENVAPARVEAVLAEFPEVDEVAVVGRPDPSWGQVVVAVVVWSGAPALAALQAWAAERLSPAERPRRWVQAQGSLPRDAAGKLRRRTIRLPGESEVGGAG